MLTYSLLFESVPWRSGQIDFAIGETTYNGLRYDCLILDKLNWLLQLNPSFMFLIPKLEKLDEAGDSTNGFIIVAKEAQQQGYTIREQGSCEVTTYFFGRPKSDRDFDWFYRLFEEGFRLHDFEDIESLNNDTILDISTKGYKNPSIISGKVSEDKLMLKARITRVA